MVGRDIASESTRREEMPEATKVTSWPAGVGQPISESRILPLKMHIWQFDHIRRTEKVRVKKGYILTSRDVVGLCVWLRTKDGALRYANLTNWRDWGYCRPADSDMSISTMLQIASDYSEWVSKFEGCNMRIEWPNWALGRGRSDWSCVRATTEYCQKSLSLRVSLIHTSWLTCYSLLVHIWQFNHIRMTEKVRGKKVTLWPKKCNGGVCVWVWSTQIDWHATHSWWVGQPRRWLRAENKVTL